MPPSVEAEAWEEARGPLRPRRYRLRSKQMPRRAGRGFPDASRACQQTGRRTQVNGLGRSVRHNNVS